ncbi:sugar kinase [Microbacterium aquimaris]|uniref:sugar kinase n=1 Tax=Microbacterium aquimaris TaxID=459816 RepID=UPI002AD331BB|nr:sugar kinase [Microbacterium aquimaris]MDZ8275272.1 sugar kinase [Microbacterium aquimaris]
MTAASVVCLGESMAQVIPIEGGLEHAKSFVITTAGAESNVAISLSRLGTSSSWAGYLGRDPLGRRVLDDLQEASVATSLVREIEGRRTGVFFKDPDADGSTVYYYRADSAATLMDDDYVTYVLSTRPRCVHVTGVTLALSPTCRASVVALADTAAHWGAILSFDVNYRPALWPDRETAAGAITRVARHSDIVFVGLDEAQALWGCDSAAGIRRMLPEPRHLIVKDGAREAVVFAGADRVSVPALAVAVVEPVGAGDAFAAGWLHGHLAGHDDVVNTRLGHLMAGVALTSHSDVGAMPTSARELVARAVGGTDWKGSAEIAIDDEGSRESAHAAI